MRVFDYIHPSLPALLGTSNVLEVGCFTEGVLHEISLKQVGGTPVAFTVNTFSARSAVAPVLSSSAYDADVVTDDVGDHELYRVTEQFGGSAGAVGGFESAEGVRYRNRDGGYARSRSRIYLVLDLPVEVGQQETSWDVRVLGRTAPSF